MKTAHVKKSKISWSDLTAAQQVEAARQLKHAGWKNESDYSRITFFVNPDGSIHGWNDPKFFI
jgi:hypothetical protein